MDIALVIATIALAFSVSGIVGGLILIYARTRHHWQTHNERTIDALAALLEKQTNALTHIAKQSSSQALSLSENEQRRRVLDEREAQLERRMFESSNGMVHAGDEYEPERPATRVDFGAGGGEGLMGG